MYEDGNVMSLESVVARGVVLWHHTPGYREEYAAYYLTDAGDLIDGAIFNISAYLEKIGAHPGT